MLAAHVLKRCAAVYLLYKLPQVPSISHALTVKWSQHRPLGHLKPLHRCTSSCEAAARALLLARHTLTGAAGTPRKARQHI